MDRKQREVANKHGVSESTVSLLISGVRYTKDAALAVQLAKLTGRKGIEFINPKYRETYGKAYPRLNK